MLAYVIALTIKQNQFCGMSESAFCLLRIMYQICPNRDYDLEYWNIY